MEEIWKNIEEYEGLYQVSNLGRVKSLDRCVNSAIKNNNKVIKKGRILKPKPNWNNYLQVHLSKHGKAKMISVHRLVAKEFIGNPNNLPQVNHIDGNKLNNRVDNLEWCTAKENINHSWKLGLSKSYKHTKGELTDYGKSLCKQVSQYDLDGNFIKTYLSISEASRNTPCSIADICCCCKGKQKTSHNFIWKYADK